MESGAIDPFCVTCTVSYLVEKKVCPSSVVSSSISVVVPRAPTTDNFFLRRNMAFRAKNTLVYRVIFFMLLL
jgi:hypothetical protein